MTLESLENIQSCVTCTNFFRKQLFNWVSSSLYSFSIFLALCYLWAKRNRGALLQLLSDTLPSNYLSNLPTFPHSGCLKSLSKSFSYFLDKKWENSVTSWDHDLIILAKITHWWLESGLSPNISSKYYYNATSSSTFMILESYLLC